MSVVTASPIVGYDNVRFNDNKKMPAVPYIEHPLKRVDDGDRSSLDIRGTSRDGRGSGQLIRSELSPTPAHRQQRRSSSLKYFSNSASYSQPLFDIPENEDTSSGKDRGQVRLPVFGHRTDSRATSCDDSKSVRRSSRILVDELEVKFREKVRLQLHDVRTKFRHAAQNDPNGRINRQALQHLIATIFGTQMQIGPHHIDKLLERLNLKNLSKISFDEFLQALFNGEEELPNWMNKQRSPRDELSSKRSATQMFNILKDKAQNKHKDVVLLCPSLNGGPSSRIFKAQFHSAIIDMGYKMKDNEFDKLWEKFDTDGFKAISSEKFLKILTSESVGIGDSQKTATTKETDHEHSASDLARSIQSSHSDSEVRTPRLNTSKSQLDENQIQKWLNHKFPQGFADLERALERLDTKQLGTLPRERFLDELRRFGLKIDVNLLDFFLKRLNIDLSLTNDGVPYRDVINIFKQKSDPTRKRINADNTLPREENRQAALEKQIDNALSMNYERARDSFHRLDNTKNGTVATNDFRSIVEDAIDYTLKADEFYHLIKQTPTDEHGRVIYKEYLKQVLDRTLVLQEQQHQKLLKNSQLSSLKSTSHSSQISIEELKHIQQEKLNKLSAARTNSDHDQQQATRSVEELLDMLKSLIRTRYKDIEEEFKRLDRGSYGELTKDLLYDLLKRLHVKPAVQHGEVDLIWSRCHLKEDGNLDFYQFLREFGYSKRSAHYPNAKRNPPKRGDSDFLLTSRKLYGDSVLVHGTVINSIKSNWNKLRMEFTELDPYRTGFVQSDEFDEIFTELCPTAIQQDLELIKSRFQTQNDARISYVRFLKHYAPIPEMIGLIDDSGRSTTLPAINDKSPRGISHASVLNQLSNKLRRKLSDNLKELRRTFKQRDPTNSGSVPVAAFREILNKFKCSLTDEEFYSLTSQIDTKMDGTIDYNYFLQQYVKST